VLYNKYILDDFFPSSLKEERLPKQNVKMDKCMNKTKVLLVISCLKFSNTILNKRFVIISQFFYMHSYKWWNITFIEGNGFCSSERLVLQPVNLWRLYQGVQGMGRQPSRLMSDFLFLSVFNCQKTWTWKSMTFHDTAQLTWVQNLLMVLSNITLLPHCKNKLRLNESTQNVTICTQYLLGFSSERKSFLSIFFF